MDVTQEQQVEEFVDRERWLFYVPNRRLLGSVPRRDGADLKGVLHPTIAPGQYATRMLSGPYPTRSAYSGC
jgi:hypothetical protein